MTNHVLVIKKYRNCLKWQETKIHLPKISGRILNDRTVKVNNYSN